MFRKALKGIQVYKLWARLYDLVTKWRMNVGEETVNGVKIKSAWLSKINWTQAVGLLAAGLTFFKLDLPAETQAAILAGITGITATVTWFFRTFKNNTVTEAPK
jgi:hypothetical protein